MTEVELLQMVLKWMDKCEKLLVMYEKSLEALLEAKRQGFVVAEN